MEEFSSPVLEVPLELVAAGGVAEPRDGHQFLANVVVERRKCNDVASAAPPPSKQNVFAIEPPKTKAAPDNLKPTIEWQNLQVADFSRIRARILLMRDQHQNKKSSNVTSKLKTNLLENEPTLTLIFSLKQDTLQNILETINEGLSEIPHGESMNPSHGRWLFAILAIIKLPLEPGIHSTLRDLARNCSDVRSRLKLDDVEAWKKTAPLNLFVCLIARYFRQSDLADE